MKTRVPSSVLCKKRGGVHGNQHFIPVLYASAKKAQRDMAILAQSSSPVGDLVRKRIR